ncbi:hypothetical protein [Halobacillus sp. A5]|uniref:hypothetical protein n=1 Tax=Halobacillus sp. A5 TaxID=2880263 RepID=UPI0020A62388|nr:hypothetical protein [Halobacillus sp. A5]MCP3028680.1 hypothetical protein [Halobacillus sp. A5]
MNNFERNYWSSYCDYIDKFDSLTYLGISIPLVSPYYVLIHENAINKLNSKSFNKYVSTNIKQEKGIQSHFEQRLSPYKKKINKRKGKIVLYDTALRIPDHMLQENFSPTETMILLQNTTTDENAHSIPAVPLLQFSNVNTKAIEAFQKKTIECLNKAKSHPIYRDEKVRKRLINLIPKIMKQISAAVNFLEATPVSCLVLGTTNSSDTRILALAAALKGIPTICLQHGVPMLEFGYLPKVATYLAVYGKYDIDWYTKKGVPPASLKDIGHPRFDELSSKKLMDKKAFHSHFKLGPKRKTVLMVIHHEETEIPRAIIAQLRKQGTVNIIVKPRNGRQRTSEKTALLQQEFPDISFAEDMDLYDLLHNVDAVVSYESTIVLEALLANKPVFIWKLKTLLPSSTNYYGRLNDYIFNEPRILVKHLTTTLEGNGDMDKWEKNKNDFLAYKYSPPSGTSIIKLKALIQSLTI